MDFQYTVLTGGANNDKPYGVIIEKYLGNSPVVKIPAKIEKIPVLEIGKSAFRDHTEISEIKLPTSVKKINKNAFCGCVNLVKINFEIDLINIDGNAFSNCPKISPKIREIIKNKKDNRFIYNVIRNQKTITIQIYNYRMYNDPAENKIAQDETFVIPDNIEGYPVTSFSFIICPVDGGKIFIPSSVIKIGSFGINENFNEIIVDDDNPVYRSIDGILYNKNGETLVHYPAEKTGVYRIPDSVKFINANLFCNCKNLTKFDVSKKNKYFSAKNGLLLNKNGNTLIKCPPGFSGICKLPDGVTVIQGNAFEYCNNVTGIILPEGLKEIYPGGISRCGIKNISIPGSLVSISDYAFAFNDELEKITLNKGIVKTGNNSFSYCSKLKTVKLPKSLKNIGCRDFRDDDNLSKQSKTAINRIVHEQEKREGSDVFVYSLYEISDDDWFNHVYTHNDTVYISKYKGREKTVVIPTVIRGIKKIIIGSNTFEGCDYIKEITIQKNVIQIEKAALADCKGLSKKCRAGIIKRYGEDVFIPYKKSG